MRTIAPINASKLLMLKQIHVVRSVRTPSPVVRTTGAAPVLLERGRLARERMRAMEVCPLVCTRLK